jgi:hypothetical protein
MRTAELLAGLALASTIAVAGCGGEPAAPPPPQLVTDQTHGLAVELPLGWQRATASLTPGLVDPREVLSVATFPPRYRPTGCAHVAGSALDDLGPRDVFLTLQERGLDRDSTWRDFPPRPTHFGPELGGPSEASECVPSACFTDHWFAFTDGDRHFHVLVAFGPQAPVTVRREAWAILDSLRIDPRVRPAWRSSG